MKQTEQVAADGKAPASKSRFFSGLFRGRRHQAPPAEGDASANTVGSGDVSRIVPAIKAEAIDGHCPKILVVDDDPVILKTVGVKLSHAGFEVVTGHDGAEAITTARKENPDVIVLDINFPPEVAVAWDGIGVMKWLQRMENGHTPPVIIITGAQQEKLREKAMEAGAVAFFQKPIDNDGLIALINKTLDQKRADSKQAKPAEVQDIKLAE